MDNAVRLRLYALRVRTKLLREDRLPVGKTRTHRSANPIPGSQQLGSVAQTVAASRRGHGRRQSVVAFPGNSPASRPRHLQRQPKRPLSFSKRSRARSFFGTTWALRSTRPPTTLRCYCAAQAAWLRPGFESSPSEHSTTRALALFLTSRGPEARPAQEQSPRFATHFSWSSCPVFGTTKRKNS